MHLYSPALYAPHSRPMSPKTVIAAMAGLAEIPTTRILRQELTWGFLPTLARGDELNMTWLPKSVCASLSVRFTGNGPTIVVGVPLSSS